MWLVGYVAVGALEPETHHSLPVIAIVLTVLFHLALAAMVVGLVARRRWGITASLGASALFLAGTVACPTTGHHTMGVWWLGQMAISLALVVGSVVALQLSAVAAAHAGVTLSVAHRGIADLGVEAGPQLRDREHDHAEDAPR